MARIVYSVCHSFALLVFFADPVNAADPSPAGWWEFDETSGVIAVDTTRNGNDGTLRGEPRWTQGISGGALECDGVDDYVESPVESVIGTASSMTVAGSGLTGENSFN
jgi:hypothetical protein